MDYNQDAYIETVKGIIKEFLEGICPETDVLVAFPDITSTPTATNQSVDLGMSLENILTGKFSLQRPLVYIEFERELNIDSHKGRSNGKGTMSKRKMLTYSFQVITTGNSRAVLARDRIIQKVTNQSMSQYELLSGKGIRKAETKYVGSYRVREGVHLARMEFYCEITFIN